VHLLAFGFTFAFAREQGGVEGCWLAFLGDIDRGFVLLLFCTRDATVICWDNDSGQQLDCSDCDDETK
jgi:hypothetical protein